ncbi:hypothetical protein Tco_0154850 [Tanacetum coccineum]
MKDVGRYRFRSGINTKAKMEPRQGLEQSSGQDNGIPCLTYLANRDGNIIHFKLSGDNYQKSAIEGY